MKWTHACKITKAAWVEHQFLFKINIDENKNNPVWVECCKIVAKIGEIPLIINFWRKKEVKDQAKNIGQTIIHKK